jgi:hypothetical protein
VTERPAVPEIMGVLPAPPSYIASPQPPPTKRLFIPHLSPSLSLYTSLPSIIITVALYYVSNIQQLYSSQSNLYRRTVIYIKVSYIFIFFGTNRTEGWNPFYCVCISPPFFSSQYHFHPNHSLFLFFKCLFYYWLCTVLYIMSRRRS